MHKLIALYQRPDDEAAFLRHYTEVHLPLVRSLPGLAHLEVTRLTGDSSGFFLLTEMSFPDAATLEAAVRSPQNAAAERDARGFAAGRVTLLRGEPLGGEGGAATPVPDHMRAGSATPDPQLVMDRQHEMDKEGKTASGAYELRDEDK